MNNNETKLMRNAVGPAIFACGAIAVVMVVMTLFKGMPTEEARGGADALARGLVGFMGMVPLALLGLGASFLGARLFVLGIDLRLQRNLLGLLLVPLALAIFLSTILPDGGGAFGEAIGGRVRLQMHSAIAFAFGVVVLVAPIWFIFVREYAMQLMVEANPPSAEREIEIQAAGGISREEADALLPEEATASPDERALKSAELVELLATQKDERPEWLDESSYSQAASPYREDVRHRGEIPEGATPLVPQEPQPNESKAQPSSVQRWAPESLRLAEDALGADLVEDEPTQVRPELVQKREPAAVVKPVEPEVKELKVEPVAKVTPLTGAQPLAVEPESLPPAPSWEQSSLFEEPAAEADQEEEEDWEEEEELDAQAEYEEGELEDEEDLEPEEAESAEYEEEEEYEEEDEDELDPAAEYEEEEDEEEDDEEEVDPAAEYEDEDEDEEEEDEESAEYEEEDEEDEELDPAAEYEEEDEDEEEELEESAEYEEEDEEELDPAAEYEEEDEEELETSAEADEEELAEAEVAEHEQEPEVAEAEVVLTPQAPPAAETTEEPAPTSGRVSDDVIYNAGVLFLERERVAVSMLQREFNLDFDESCEVMDRLQTMGLIGPYVGGHRRDILLNKDEWMERVTLP